MGSAVGAGSAVWLGLGGARLGLGAAMGFDHPGQYFDTLAQLRVSRLQHGVGFAHARTGTKVNLQLSAMTLAVSLQQRVGIGTLGFVVHRFLYTITVR